MSYKAIIKSLIAEEMNTLQEKLRGKFNLATFKEMSRHPDLDTVGRLIGLKHYAWKHLGEHMGEGSSRLVWILSGNKVLKLATDLYKTEAGMAQNKQEVDLWTNPKTKEGVAAVLDYDPEYKWIISELVNPVTRENAIAYLGMEEGYFERILRICLKNTNNSPRFITMNILEGEKKIYENDLAYYKELNDERHQQIIKNLERFIVEMDESIRKLKSGKLNKVIKMIEALQGLVDTVGLHVDDILRSEHYGKTKDGRIVVLDYGFSDEIYEKYYQ